MEEDNRTIALFMSVFSIIYMIDYFFEINEACEGAGIFCNASFVPLYLNAALFGLVIGFVLGVIYINYFKTIFWQYTRFIVENYYKNLEDSDEKNQDN